MQIEAGRIMARVDVHVDVYVELTSKLEDPVDLPRMIGVVIGSRAYHIGTAFETLRLRALAVTTATRSDALPDVATVGEFVQGYEASVWWGFGAPKNAPKEIIDKLNQEINAGLADLKIKTRLAELGGTALAGSPADIGRLIADDARSCDFDSSVACPRNCYGAS
jgi:hypothetical protein